MRSVSIENGSGGSSPGCISSAAQSMVRAVEPRRRSGLQPAERKAEPLQRQRQARRAGASPTRPAGVCRSPIWIRPRRNVPVVSTTAPQASSRPSARRTPVTRAVADHQIVDLALDHRQIRGLADRALHRRRIELAVRLGARPAHRRSLAPVEHAELDAARVGDPAHQAVERIDLAHQMALAEPADRRIAGHRADGREPVRDQRGRRAHARSRGRGLAAGVPAADHDDVESCVHRRSFYRRPGSPTSENRAKLEPSRRCSVFT